MLKEFPIPRVSVELIDREACGRSSFISARILEKSIELEHAPEVLTKSRYTFTRNRNFINNWGK
jgi:hypothetical protein